MRFDHKHNSVPDLTPFTFTVVAEPERVRWEDGYADEVEITDYH
jgi:hypothetical protein